MSLGKEKCSVRKFQADLGWKKPLVVSAILLLAISGVTRLIEFWITNGTGGVT